VTRIVAAYGEPFGRAMAGPARHPAVEKDRNAHTSSRPSAVFTLSQLAYAVRQGDRMQRVDTGALYVISEPRRNGFGRVAVDLNIIG
jgi:hypothetical protein